MKQGADVDIITGQPSDKINTVSDAAKQAHDETILRGRLEYLGLSASPDGKKIIEMVQEQLFHRIEEMVKQDPKAQAFMLILTTLGIKESEAKKAAGRLTAMKIKQE